MSWNRVTTLILMASLVPFACKKAPPPPPPSTEATPPPISEPTPAVVGFKITSIQLGKAIGLDKRISEPAATFGPQDTIYASAESEGTAPSVTLKARWTFGDAGQLVSESEQTIAPTGPAATEFHVSKASGWPAGKYKVEISADGSVVGTQDFEVKK